MHSKTALGERERMVYVVSIAERECGITIDDVRPFRLPSRSTWVEGGLSRAADRRHRGFRWIRGATEFEVRGVAVVR
jgi:hypothetical protein